MFTQAFGEILTDILTINPAIGSIPSASAILDTSNFTFNAVTFGKDADGFRYHAHTVSSEAAGVYNGGFVATKNYNNTSPSSYHFSSTYYQFSSTYSSMPQYPTIYDTRLEKNSTVTNVSAASTSDVGHYLNAAIDPILSSVWNVIGGYPPSGNSAKYILTSSNGDFICSGNLSGVYNSKGIIDKLGFIKINQAPFTVLSPTDTSSGPFIYAGSQMSSTCIVQVATIPQMGDAASLTLFGGVNHIGIWCLDLKQMLANGLTPPFAWNALNNTRLYKLVAKVTSKNNLMLNNDVAGIFSGIQYFMNLGQNANGYLGPGLFVTFNFK